jgi:uncharacterized protein YaaN involved in tellurite resistance
MFNIWKKIRQTVVGNNYADISLLQQRYDNAQCQIQQMQEIIGNLEARNKWLENQIRVLSNMDSDNTNFDKKLKEASLAIQMMGHLESPDRAKFWAKVEEASSSIRQVLNDKLPNTK